jgi:hypothetical protein
MTALGNNVHIFARPTRREALKWLFETVLQCGPVATLEHPGMAEPMLVVRLPEGGSISIEFIEDAADGDQPRFATWLELRTAEPDILMRTVLEAGLREVKHPRSSVLLRGTGRPGVHDRPRSEIAPVVPRLSREGLPRGETGACRRSWLSEVNLAIASTSTWRN